MALKKIITDKEKVARWDAYRAAANATSKEHNKLRQLCLDWVRTNHPEVLKELRRKCGL